MHHRHAVSDRPDDRDVVGDEDIGQLFFFLQAQKQFEDTLRVEYWTWLMPRAERPEDCAEYPRSSSVGDGGVSALLRASGVQPDAARDVAVRHVVADVVYISLQRFRRGHDVVVEDGQDQTAIVSYHQCQLAIKHLALGFI